MAKRNSGASAFLKNMGYLLLSLLLLINSAESRTFLDGTAGVVQCEAVVAVQSGDTCFSVAESSKLATENFSAINPNLNCNALFVGQWLCVKGSV